MIGSLSPYRLIALSAVCAASAIATPVSAQSNASREVVQPLPSQEVQRLNRALMELARSPGSVSGLIEAADASLEAGDVEAAVGFYGRAADLAPNDPRVKLGLGRTYLRAGRPVDAIPFLSDALTSGAPPRDVLSDQALAFDLVGDQAAAQTAYARAIELNPQDDEARRRLAISQAISGNEGAFQSTLAPLIEGRDPAAFRARAFGLAILGEQSRAAAIVNQVMPADLAARINPYLEYMPRLTAAQQAAAANLGIFPRAADIGREDPRIARFAEEGSVGSLLEPAGEPLGAPAAGSEEATVASSGGEESGPQQVASSDAGAATVASPVSASAAPTTTFVSGEVAQATPSSVAQTAPAPTPPASEPTPSVADAFADLGGGELPVAGSASGAVDLGAIDIPRETAASEEPERAAPEPPANPSRIWVQIATGRDVDALRFDWRRLSRRAGGSLDDYRPHITPWGEANRLLAGPIANRSAARDLVNALAESGIETFTYTSPKGVEIQQLD